MLRIVAGKYKGRVLVSPSMVTRPTTSMVRQALFNIWSDCIGGADFLDLFSGSGAVGLEAMSRGAKEVFLVESNKKALQVIVKNIASLGIEKSVKLVKDDVLKFLHFNQKKFNLIFVDPPYDWIPGHGSRGKLRAGFYTSYLANILAPFLKTEGELVIEQSKSTKEPLEEIEGLLFIETRIYGDCQLHRFSKL